MTGTVSQEAFNRLVRHFAEYFVYDWVTSDHWLGYPGTEEEERTEVEMASLPGGHGHSEAKRILHILGLTVEKEENG